MVHALRWFAALAVVALVTEAAPADSGRAADRAGQRMGPGKAEQDRGRAVRGVCWARWLAAREQELARRRQVVEAFLQWWVLGDGPGPSGDGPPPGQ